MARIAETGEKIGDRVGEHRIEVVKMTYERRFGSRGSQTVGFPLPGRFFYAGDEAATREFSEADAAEVESPHVASDPPAQAASIIEPGGELRFFPCGEGAEEGIFDAELFYFDCFASHGVRFLLCKGKSQSF